MIAKVYTEPAAEPVSTAEAKAHLRVSISDDDTYIGALITAARRMVEAQTNRALITQVWDYYLDRWPVGDSFPLPFAPLQTVTGVYYTDTDDTTATMSATTEYQADTSQEPGRIVLRYGESWPSPTLSPMNPIKVRFTAGYGLTGATCPADLVHAIKMIVAHLYEMREPVVLGQTVAQIPMTVDWLLSQYRIWLV